MTKSKGVPKDYFWQHLFVLRVLGVNIIPIQNFYLRILYNVYSFTTVIVTFILFLIFEFLAFIDSKDDMDKVTFILGYWICHFMGKSIIFIQLKMHKI